MPASWRAEASRSKEMRDPVRGRIENLQRAAVRLHGLVRCAAQIEAIAEGEERLDVCGIEADGVAVEPLGIDQSAPEDMRPGEVAERGDRRRLEVGGDACLFRSLVEATGGAEEVRIATANAGQRRIQLNGVAEAPLRGLDVAIEDELHGRQRRV